MITMEWQQIIVVRYICSSNTHNATYENIGWNSVSDRCYKMFRINTDSWKLQVLIKRMDSEIFLYVQNFSSIYTRENDSTIHFNLLWIINFLSRWNKLLILHTFKSNNLCQPRWRRCSGLDCGSGDQDSIPGLPPPLEGSLMASRLKTSSDDPMPLFWWLGTLKTPSWQLRWVPGNRA